MFTTFLVQPIYNCFILILGLVPGGDVGIAIITLTIVVRLLFYPLFTSSIRTQMAMQAVQPELAEINEKYKGDQVERARRQQELFGRHRIHPFTTIGVAIVQVIIFIGLSYAFFRLGLPKIRTDLLYPFIPTPHVVNEQFLGFVNLTAVHNIVLTIIVVILQYAVIRLSLARTAASTAHLTKEQARAQEIQRQMMLYLFPIALAFAAYLTAAAVGLYLGVSTLFSLIQELIIRRKPL